jgi:hypothetical protein
MWPATSPMTFHYSPFLPPLVHAHSQKLPSYPDATRYGVLQDTHTPQAIAFVSVAWRSSSYLAFLQMSSKPWVIGPLTHSSNTGEISKASHHFMHTRRDARRSSDHQATSNAIGIAIWGKPMSSSVSWAIPIALGVHPPTPLSFAPWSSQLAIDSFYAPHRLQARLYLSFTCDCTNIRKMETPKWRVMWACLLGDSTRHNSFILLIWSGTYHFYHKLQASACTTVFTLPREFMKWETSGKPYEMCFISCQVCFIFISFLA